MGTVVQRRRKFGGLIKVKNGQLMYQIDGNMFFTISRTHFNLAILLPAQ